MPENFNDPKAIAEKGIQIYNERYCSDYERDFKGQFVAINVLDGSATLGNTPTETLLQAKKDQPNGIFHLIRVGHDGAFEVGLAYRNVSPDRVHR